MKSILLYTVGGLALAGLVTTASFPVPQSPESQERDRAGLQATDKSQLELDVPQAISFRVQHTSSLASAGRTPPGTSDGSAATTKLGVAHELRFDFRTQPTTRLDPGQGGMTTLLLDVSKLNDDAPANRQGVDGAGGADRPKSATPSQSPGAKYRLLVDGEGRVVRMEDIGAGAGGSRAADGIDHEQLKSDLAIILGTGLHERKLSKNNLYEVGPANVGATGTPTESATPRQPQIGGDEDTFVLRFEAVQAALPTAGAADREAKEAAFTILQETDATIERRPGATEPRDTTPAQGQDTLGRATYSLADGLVVRFEVHPRASTTELSRGNASGQDRGSNRIADVQERLTIERISKP